MSKLITKIDCPECGVTVAKNMLARHVGTKACENNQKNMQFKKKKGECFHCKMDTSQMTTSAKANHSRWCDKNPKRNDYIGSLNSRVGENNPMFGKTAWNNGLTKETDTRLKQTSKTYSDRCKSGEIIPHFRGKTHTVTSKEKMSEIQRNNDYQRVCKSTVDYICKDGTVVKMDSSWEVKVAEVLDERDISWERPKPLRWEDKAGKQRNYFADFYLPVQNLYLDPKNSWVQHEQKSKIEYLANNYDNIIIGTLEEILELVKMF